MKESDIEWTNIRHVLGVGWHRWIVERGRRLVGVCMYVVKWEREREVGQPQAIQECLSGSYTVWLGKVGIKENLNAEMARSIMTPLTKERKEWKKFRGREFIFCLDNLKFKMPRRH